MRPERVPRRPPGPCPGPLQAGTGHFRGLPGWGQSGCCPEPAFLRPFRCARSAGRVPRRPGPPPLATLRRVRRGWCPEEGAWGRCRGLHGPSGVPAAGGFGQNVPVSGTAAGAQLGGHTPGAAQNRPGGGWAEWSRECLGVSPRPGALVKTQTPNLSPQLEKFPSHS